MTEAPRPDSDAPLARAFDREEARIHEAYAARAGSSLRYSWFNAAHRYMVIERERRVLELLGRHGVNALEDKRILDVGCGTGQWILDFVKWGAHPANIVGIDLLPERIERARVNCPAAVTLLRGNAARADFADESFDVIVQSTVFTSILDPGLRRELALRMLRLLTPNGVIVWYDYYVNNPGNSNVRAVTRAELTELFPNAPMDVRRVTLAPPIVRRVAPFSWLLCQLLELVPLLRTHYLGIIRKPLAR